MWTFELESNDFAEQLVIKWVNGVRALLGGAKSIDGTIYLTLEMPKKRRILVVINPFGGTKQGVPIYEKYVHPMFKIANMDVTMICNI